MAVSVLAAQMSIGGSIVFSAEQGEAASEQSFFGVPMICFGILLGVLVVLFGYRDKQQQEEPESE